MAAIATPSTFNPSIAALHIKARHPYMKDKDIAAKVTAIEAKISTEVAERRAISEAVKESMTKEAGDNMVTYKGLVEGHRVSIFWINDDPRHHKNPRSRCVVAVWDKDTGTVTYGATIHTRERPSDALTRFQKPAHLVRAAERFRDAPNVFTIDHKPRKADMHRALAQLGCKNNAVAGV